MWGILCFGVWFVGFVFFFVIITLSRLTTEEYSSWQLVNVAQKERDWPILWCSFWQPTARWHLLSWSLRLCSMSQSLHLLRPSHQPSGKASSMKCVVWDWDDTGCITHMWMWEWMCGRSLLIAARSALSNSSCVSFMCWSTTNRSWRTCPRK